MGSIFSPPKPPPAPPPPPPLPEPAPLPAPEGDKNVEAARRKKISAMQKRSGRQSTILSEGGNTGETLGGG